MSNVLVFLGNPDKESFCGALAKAYADGARQGGHEVRELAIGELQFEPNLVHGYRQSQALEADLVRAQEWISWADHMAFIFPLWWGSVPAVMKGFFDRAWLPGFAFEFGDSPLGWKRLLTGRSARLVVTMESPWWLSRWVLGDTAVDMLRGSILGFAGITTLGVTRLDRIAERSQSDRELMLQQVALQAADIPPPSRRKRVVVRQVEGISPERAA